MGKEKSIGQKSEVGDPRSEVRCGRTEDEKIRIWKKA